MSIISFKQFTKQLKKKGSKYGTNVSISGLPSFSFDDPYFARKLRIPDDDKDRDRKDREGGDRNVGGGDDECDPSSEYCYPWQNQGPNEDGSYGNDPDNPKGNWNEYYAWLECVRDPNCDAFPNLETETEIQQDCGDGQVWNGTECVSSCLDGQVWNGTECVDEGPSGTDDLRDPLWDPRNYRGCTGDECRTKSSKYSLYYQGE